MTKQMHKNKTPEDKGISLKDYYKTRWWREFRKGLLDDKNCKCEICGIKRWEEYVRKQGYKKPKVFNIHHKTYSTMFRERRGDVLTLCQSSHKYAHDSEMMSRTRGGIYTQIYNMICNTTKWVYKKRGK